jgi:hypothetical protein
VLELSLLLRRPQVSSGHGPGKTLLEDRIVKPTVIFMLVAGDYGKAEMKPKYVPISVNDEEVILAPVLIESADDYEELRKNLHSSIDMLIDSAKAEEKE